MMSLALKELLCILADSQLFVGVRLIPFGSNLFPSGCRSPPSPPHSLRPPFCHTPALHLHVITLLFAFPSFSLLSLPVCFMKERNEFGMCLCFFFSEDNIHRWVFLWVGCGCWDKQKLLLFVTAPTPGPRGNPAKCEFHTAILGSTVFFCRNAYSSRLRRSISPSQKRVFTIARAHLAQNSALPPTLSFLQVPETGSTAALPSSGVFPAPQLKNDGRARIRPTGQ